MPRIVSDTPSEIVIEDRPFALAVLLGLFLLAAARAILEGIRTGEIVPALAGAAIAALIWIALNKAVRHVRLTLRADGGATLRTRSVSGASLRDFAPGTLRAGLATNHTDGPTHRVMLLVETPDGLERLPLTAYLGGSTSHEAVVARINDWARAAGTAQDS